jgi:hypothetical protein
MRFIRKRRSRLYTLESPKFRTGCVFQVEKYRSDGTITYKGPLFNNIVLDVGLDSWSGNELGGYDSLTHRLNVGTGSSEPSTGQTGLDSYTASTDAILDSSYTYDETADPVYVSLWRKWEFPIGSCTGNLTELGLSTGGGGVYFNRQLFRDEYGDPVTITVLDDEGLRVDGTVFVYAPLLPSEQITGSFLLNESVTINYHLEMAFGLHGFGTWVIYDLDRSGDEMRLSISDTYSGYDRGQVGSDDRHSYLTGSFERLVTTTLAPGAFVGDGARLCTGHHNKSGSTGTDAPLFHFRLDDVIPVADNEELTIEWKMSWGRY